MAYKFNVFLPGINKTIPVKEITSKQYRDLVKSLYNEDKDVFLEHIESTIEDILPEVMQESFTAVDYLILLLTSRMICVNPDIKFTTVCPDSKKEIECVVKMEDILKILSTIKHKNVLTHNNLRVTYSLLKGRDITTIFTSDKTLEMYHHFVSSIDSVQTESGDFTLNGLTFEKRLAIVESLPIQITNKIYADLIEVYKKFNTVKLLEVKSPYTNKVIVDLSVSLLTEDIFSLLKLLFNDDLGNIYKLTYNLVSIVGFTPEYLDNITPAEQFLYWSLHLQKVNKENEDSKNKPKETLPMYDGLTLPTNKVSQSEFTVEK